jgi:hypothetical protein
MDQCCALWASISMLAGEQFLTFRVRSQLLPTARRLTGVEQLDGLPHGIVKLFENACGAVDVSCFGGQM